MRQRNFASHATKTGRAEAQAKGVRAVAAHEAVAGRRSQAGLRFPKKIWWGTATSAYQIEGAAAEDGRKPSIWDTFSRRAGTTRDGVSGEVACDHYHHWAEDVKLMAELGIKHYRFGISWSRVLPEGRGPVNGKGLEFYQRLADALQERGITPHATLYHWDLPQALQDRYGGWQSRQVAQDFADYAGVVTKQLGDRIRN